MTEGERRTLRVGISACLLGERVRYDGGHKRDAFLADVLGKHVEWVPVCPEVELGLGVPRPPMDLVDVGGATRLIVASTGEDLTDPMRAYAAWRAKGLASLELDGYVLKSKSPSCARERGLFAQALAEAMPELPMEEESRLVRPSARAHFAERLLVSARWRAFSRRPVRAGELQAFHAAHKYALLAHSPAHYAALGRLVAAAAKRPMGGVLEAYGAGLTRALAVRATRGRHVNVLQHIAGFFGRALSAAEHEALTAAIEDYRGRRLPLDVPLALIRAHVDRLGVAYLAGQVYLQPHSAGLLS
jgi:uncharacterized protein YbgA (DUF1722 family)/uncharacterized protein YbbK (DUF523 family)